jgi:DNA invertase Pin-like site-specific DNA recombinase
VTRAVLLARVSTKKRSQDTSAPRQLAQLRELAKRQRWTVVAALTDRLSGAEVIRPGLVEALALIRNGKADVLAVHDLDRLGRDTRELLATLDAIRAWGGDLCVRDSNVDTTAQGRLGFTVVAALAEYQRRNNSEKVLSGLAHARKKGVRLGRPPSIPAPVVARAVKLRRQRPRPPWSTIVRTLKSEKLGSFAKGTVAGAVTRAMARPPRKGRRASNRSSG